jgi:hypothetical protein
MKLVFDKKGSNDRLPTNVIAIPTTAIERYFFSVCKDANGNYKPEVYNALYDFDKQIIDNPMSDIYDNHGNLVWNSEVIMNMVRDAKQESDFAAIPKPSNICILSLYYTFSKRYNKVRRLNLLYKRMIKLWHNQSIVVSKEGDNNDDTKQY